MGVVVGVVAGCEGSKTYPEMENEPVQMKARLEAFDSCAALETFIEDTATKQMRAYLESTRNGGYWFSVDDGAIPPSAPTAGGSGGEGGSRGPDNHTGTNNQVEGVHEADFVQNDGTHIFVLSGTRLYLHRSWPAEQLTLAATLDIEGWPSQMLYDEARHRLVIASQVFEERPGYPSLGTRGGGLTGGADMPAPGCVGRGCGYAYSDTMKVTVVDVSAVASPQVVQQVYLPGNYLSARRVDGTVRFVLSDAFRWPAGVKMAVDYSREVYEDKDKLNKAIDALIVQNEKLIREQTLALWRPEGRNVSSDGASHPLSSDCHRFFHANAPLGLGFVTVLSLDLDAAEGAAPVDRTSVVTYPGQLYASAESLYLATPHWWWRTDAAQKDFSYLHKFDIREVGKTTYVASGTVEGTLVNQFSLDEHEGVLRVATTVRTASLWDPSSPVSSNDTTTYSRVVTLGEQDGQLVELGRSEDLAKGERIFSARFVGDRGYVVTFRQVDPLFTFDLSDPAHPRKVGELKIPGFSTYIHPLGTTHLLTLGEDRNEDGTWTNRALKLSLFDVSDLAHPKETFTHRLGSMSSYSEALYEHKAFNYFAEKKLLAIPFTDFIYSPTDYWSGFRSDLLVFRVDTATGFSPVGSVSMGDVYRTLDNPQWSWNWQPQVRRSVMADDYVYAITDAGVRVAKLESLQTPLATTLFQAPTP
ncbi:beta-propeller domain-containing protein [Myxococcus sp. K15C18031901]|nr:beta-propeller domain-containing protein [Myxococcus dinghuensis]